MARLGDTLAADPMFAALAAEDREAIAGLGRRRSHPAGAVLFQRGDPGRELLVVEEGRVRLSVLSPEGRELSLRHAGPGSVIGEIAVLDGGPRSADATAATDVTLHAIGKADLDRLMTARPAIARTLLSVLCGRLRDTTDQLESVALFRLEARLARFLLGLLKREAGPRTAAGVRLDLPFSQGEIADVIGASRPKVNRAFADLEAAGGIVRGDGGLICRPARLAAIAEGDEA